MWYKKLVPYLIKNELKKIKELVLKIFMEYITKKPRTFQRLIGLSLKEFDLLAKKVKIELKKHLNNLDKEKSRERAPGGGRKSKLLEIEDKLLVTLLYYKAYLTQEFLGAIFDIGQSNISRTISLISKVIENAADPRLNKYLEEAKRNAPLGNNFIANQADFIRAYPDLEDISTDATESPRYRPKDSDANKKFYSGKNKNHTIKTQITVSSGGKVLDVSDSYPGSMHDKTLLAKELTIEKTTRYSPHWMDKGYCGVDKEHPDKNILIPFKKPKGGTLSKFQKEVNRHNSRRRIVVEHTIGKLKKNRIISDVYRGPINSFNQIFRNIAAISNFKLATASP